MRLVGLEAWIALCTVVCAMACGGPSSTDAGTDGAVSDGGPRDAAPRDGGGSTCAPPGSECDIYAQNCMTGEACRYVVPTGGSEPTGLCEAAGTLQEGEACQRSGTEQDMCAEGMICLDGVCRQYCCNGQTEDCTMATSGVRVCQSFIDSIVGFCVPGDNCNLVTQVGCESSPGEACYPLGTAGLTTCAMEGTVAIGDACGSANGCVGGATCLGAVCRVFCDLAAPTCDTGFMCAQVTDPSGATLPAGLCLPT